MIMILNPVYSFELIVDAYISCMPPLPSHSCPSNIWGQWVRNLNEMHALRVEKLTFSLIKSVNNSQPNRLPGHSGIDRSEADNKTVGHLFV